ncbi:WD repeat-containing protein 91-like [Salvia splendens]|uniref:WD repeat-containing protein 91-like n=1 Tax=Salvia splendens TaxID=180675 RepID=UPI001C25A062|nr:WD repeat-containing protein 91-like [Salvia splendens]
MEQLQFADGLVKEFLLYRGFTSTLQAFEKDLATDVGEGFQVDDIMNLIFGVYVPQYEAAKLIDLLIFFNTYTNSDQKCIDIVAKLQQSVLRYYVVYCLKHEKRDAVLELFEYYGKGLARTDPSWCNWFSLPYLPNPLLDSRFNVFFSDVWFQTLYISLRTFLRKILTGTRTPALLEIVSERDTVKQLQQEIQQLSLKLSQAQTSLKAKEAQSSSGSNDPAVDSRSNDDSQSCKEVSVTGSDSDQINEEDFPQVKTKFQYTFEGHTSPISCSRFSASGDNVASASVDGTVSIWTFDSSAPTSRNATIHCGAEIMSLEWDCRSNNLLLMGTSDGCIKAWNADAKRLVCDLNSSEAYPSILDLKCSPVEPILVSAAASGRQVSGSSESSDSLGFASLTVWNLKSWKAVTVLPLGKDPPAITSLSFNGNGKLLAAAGTGGSIHMFDMSSCKQLVGWTAHDCAITSILFGPNESSIFSLGTDGNICEWSLKNLGKVISSRNCSRFCNLENSSQWRHEMAFDAERSRLLVTSGLETAPIYRLHGQSSMGTLRHKGSITTVDWHPRLPILLTGSSDHSVMVTSISLK